MAKQHKPRWRRRSCASNSFDLLEGEEEEVCFCWGGTTRTVAKVSLPIKEEMRNRPFSNSNAFELRAVDG